MILYTNGVVAAQTAASGKMSVTQQPLSIGENLDDFSDYFNGYIDDVQIYNRALSPEEIEQLYELPY